MKKKQIAEPIISPEIWELAKKSQAELSRLETPRPAPHKQCAVCGASCTRPTGPDPGEDLCWVCRRLKISAWRDTDQQASAQE